jgi:hypothetical protein
MSHISVIHVFLEILEFEEHRGIGSFQTIFYNLLNSRRHIHKHTTDGQIDGRKIWR